MKHMRSFTLQQVGLILAKATRILVCFAACTVSGQQLPQLSDGLTGYISMSISTVPDGYGYGVSFYSSVWPLLEKPLAGFQIGLPGTWLTPDNRTFTNALCPPGTYARDNWPTRGPYYQDVFQTIEGGMGFWGSTQFGATSPKFRMNGTPDCYSGQISSPGWGFGTTTSLSSSDMGLAQLSNRLLVPPDGLTFQNGTAGQLFGMAWMAMPYSETVTDYFALTTRFVEGEGLYLNGNKVATGAYLGGAAYLAALSASNTFAPGQLWETLAGVNGYFGLTTRYVEAAGLVFEGNKVEPGYYLGGASFMASPPGPGQFASGQLWKMLPDVDGYFALTTSFVEGDGLVLEGNKVAPGSDLGGATHMTHYIAPGEYYAGQLWRRVRFPDHGTLHTGPFSWTLFVSAANCKGPLAFWIPQTWSKLSDSYSVIEGRGLDSRLGLVAGGAMEFNTVPCFQATNQGVVYTRIPKILFPVNSNGVTQLMQDVTVYSSGAIYEQALDWFNGGGIISGRFNSAAGSTPQATANPIGFQQGSRGLAINGLDAFVATKILGAGSFGLQWVNATNPAALPEYFRQQNDVTTAVSASAVPDSTQLKSQTFAPAYTGETYTSSGTQWSNPGPVSGPYQAHLSDGTVVTYAWYRFVDQPAFQHLNLTAEQKQRWQSIIESIHANWGTSTDYIPPPSQGTLVTLDSALLVTPPAGLEVGYVPIVTKQEMGGPWLTARFEGNQIVVSWNIGQTLQTATDITGPWQTVTNAQNPYSVLVSESRRFYRVVSR